jgi:2-polyprenyl-3-methyl-5-hydroxy-6-metoxy-1,4-benzoquinol methylase
MDNVLEHLDDVVATMKQIQRVLKPGCSAFIIVPYAHTEGAVYDPQHKHLFLPQTFHYFTPEGPPYTRMNFKAKTRLTCLSHNAHLRIRTIIPFRSLLTRFIRNMYDCVEATMTKMDPAAP